MNDVGRVRGESVDRTGIACRDVSSAGSVSAHRSGWTKGGSKSLFNSDLMQGVQLCGETGSGPGVLGLANRLARSGADAPKSRYMQRSSTIAAASTRAAVDPGLSKQNAELPICQRLREAEAAIRADSITEVHCGPFSMESTHMYWIPLHELLEEHGFEVLLVNARQLKNVPGRKTDMQDCQWLQQLHACGLLRGSFRPHESVTRLRSLHRQMQNSGGATDAIRAVDAAGAGPDERAGAPGGERPDGPDRDGDRAGDRERGARP